MQRSCDKHSLSQVRASGLLNYWITNLGQTMKTAKNLSLLLDLVLLAASLSTGSSVGEGIQRIVVLVAMMVAVFIVVCAVVLTIGVWGQRQPPYPMGGTDG